MGIIDDIKNTFRHGTNLTRLIYLNIAIFILVTVAGVLAFLLAVPGISIKTINLLSVPASFRSLLTKPWTVITYMFTHKDFFHIFFNMLWLYWFGKIFLEYLDQKKLVAVYLLGGISGAVIFILSFNVFPAFTGTVRDSVALGASASVMAVVISIAAYVPDHTISLFLFGRIRIKYIALLIFLFSSVMDFSVNSGGKLAHIGGAVFGYIFAIKIKQGRDIGRGINKVLDSVFTMFKPKKKMKVTYKRPADDYEYNTIKAEHQARINGILEKISKGGYDSLTKDEKQFLFNESQKKN
jgi:membrane associated rhomboid family serine protease